MFISRKKKQLFEETLKAIEFKICKLQDENIELNKRINDSDIFNAIGLVYIGSKNDTDRIRLLYEARLKGFFDRNNAFSWNDEHWYTHSPSYIAANYSYNGAYLVISAIGIGNNYSVGGVTIYKSGNWAKIKPISEIEQLTSNIK